jgi:uncharacterized repeat protein (TIGR03833 family)
LCTGLYAPSPEYANSRDVTKIVVDVLTPAAVHSRGIKVRLEDGQIGRARDILADE